MRESSQLLMRGQYRNVEWPDVEVPPGSKNRANTNKGHPGTWEISLSPCLRKPEKGHRRKKPLARGQKRPEAQGERRARTQAINGIAE